MQELISRVVQNVGIDEATAKPAIGIVMQALKSVLPEGLASSLMAAMPGAESLMGEAQEAGGGGLGGMLGGAMSSLGGGSAGAAMQALSQLQGLGLGTDQAKSVTQQVVGFAKEQAPPDVGAALDEKLGSLLG
ncbi:MAG: DUF2267 domain-containing protein [Alphaproteobacteria bacterium]|nr:DUF2267 domain-containing protein [Alphaproteobacteria bacterium]